VPVSSVHALIVPHAGYVYSGSVAAHAYALLRGAAFERVVLLGPSHRVALQGVALPTVSRFRTPLGDVMLDTDCMRKLGRLSGVEQRDDAHAMEHCLEVQLPFLQTVLNEFRLIPAVVGLTSSKQIEDLLDAAVDERTLVIISTDLSHYHDYASARVLDARTVARIEARDAALDGEEACGACPLNGFLRYASRRGWKVSLLAARNSGDACGDRRRVVGYASFVVC
jgi:AmmeMemoRadiSam system protein B